MDTQHGQTTSQEKAPYFGYLPDGRGGMYYNPEMVEYAVELRHWNGMTREEAEAEATREFTQE